MSAPLVAPHRAATSPSRTTSPAEGAAAFDPSAPSPAPSWVFQPIVDLRGGKAVRRGYEALARFESGLDPQAVLESAWEQGRGEELELATVESLGRTLRRLPASYWYTFNVSARLLVAAPERVAHALLPLGARRRIYLELVEWGRHPDLIEALNRFGLALAAANGPLWRLAMDDISVSRENASLFRALWPELIKTDLIDDPHTIEWVIERAARVGAMVVAERIETVEQAEMVRAAGVELGQGYLFGRPEPLA